MMHRILDPVATVEAVSQIVRHHRHADVERMTHYPHHLCVRKRHRYERQPDLVERHLVDEPALAGFEESGGFGAREVVVPEHGCRVAMIGRKGLRQVGGEPLGNWKQVVRQLAKLRRKRKFATRAHRRMAREHLFDERRSGAWETHDEDWLRHVGANGRTRQQLELVSNEELPKARKKFFDGFSLVAQSAALGGELRFALDKITPGVVISSN